MFVRSVVLCVCLILNLSVAYADVDMQRLQQLMELSDQLEQESSNTDTSATPSSQEQTWTPLPTLSSPIQRVLIDVRSTHSDGVHDMPTLIQLAKKRGINSLAFTEHDRYSIRFGIDPMPHILGYSMQHPSLYVTGLDNFFDDLHTQRAKHPDIQLFAGTESTPGYSWSGIPFRNLTLHNAERHLITLGIEKPEQVEGLSSYDLRHAYGNQAISLAFWCAVIFLLIIVLMRRRKRGMALLVMASFIAFLSSWLMKPDIDADEDFINTAHEQGLFVIWTHPGTLSGVREGPMGVQLDTPPYNLRTFQEPTADAFAAIYGDTDQNTAPGGLWDRYLEDYMFGRHAKPMWAVAAGDYHEEGMAHEYLGNFPMDVWAKDNSPSSILSALRQGHMVAWGMQKDHNISVQALYLEDATGKRLLPGDEAKLKAPVHVVAALGERVATDKAATLTGEWIVDGRVVQQVSLTNHATQAQVIPLNLSKGPHVVRLQINQGIRMVANPFLVHIE